MGKLKKYDSATDTWTTIATGGGGSSGGGGTSFDTNFFATMSKNQNLGSSSDTKVAFDTVVTDDNSEWDAANTKWTCKEDGVYHIFALLSIQADANGYRGVRAYKNAAVNLLTAVTGWNSGTGSRQRIQVSAPISLVAGDDIEIYAIQNSGSTLTINATECLFAIHRIH